MFHRRSGTTTGVLDPEAATTAEALEEVLFYQRCRWCGTSMFHRLLCPVCAGSDLRTERSAGLGVVRHTTVVQRNTPGARNVSLVELAEGFTVRGRVSGPLVAIRTGDRVQLTTPADPVRREPVFKLCEEPFSGSYPGSYSGSYSGWH
ncbi:putative OB-fold protein [Streptomyces aurantiacus]|uniref:Zn-ribbon domain-containing OB-fold protein n=1 Tax=Streptomyces aurantiacus TaxID=47760 RepID=UPI002794EAE4|nr:zinc ribbon domain-containing protein [Streptomyces aurantiacus]MDQ0772499.1 putative OB-fold protein [Streptomyces aurantiacus]